LDSRADVVVDMRHGRIRCRGCELNAVGKRLYRSGHSRSDLSSSGNWSVNVSLPIIPLGIHDFVVNHGHGDGQRPSDFSPFNLPMQQALLKIVFGPLVAVVRIAILSTHALHVAPPGTWPALLLLAVMFGAGQQAVTRYVDHRAGEILAVTAPSPTRKTTSVAVDVAIWWYAKDFDMVRAEPASVSRCQRDRWCVTCKGNGVDARGALTGKSRFAQRPQVQLPDIGLERRLHPGDYIIAFVDNASAELA
jgi:hypothetical protein